MGEWVSSSAIFCPSRLTAKSQQTNPTTMKLIYCLLTATVATVLSACGGGGGGDTTNTPVAPVTPVAPTPTPGGGSTGDTSSTQPVKFTDGDTYTYKVERTDFFNGIAASPEVSHYTHTIRNSKSNFEHERIYTASSRDQQVETYNSNNFQTSIAYAQYGCAMTSGQDGPGFTLKVGHQWDSRYSSQCTKDVTYPSDFHSTGSITAKETIKTEAGDFSAYKAEKSREQKNQSFTSILKSICWYDEKTAMMVTCDDTYRTTGTDGKTLEYRVETTLTGINVKNHPTKVLTPTVYAGEWQVSFSGTLQGWCDVKISANGDMSGTCRSEGSYSTATGKIAGDGTMRIRSGNYEFTGKLSNSLEVSDTSSGTSPANYSINWTAKHN